MEPEPRRRPAWEALQAEEKARASGAYEEPTTSKPPPRRTGGLFSRGTFWPSIRVGRGSIVDEKYLILGAGLGYFVIDGLAPGIAYDVWLLGDPTLHVLTGNLTYVFHMVPYVKPYVGVLLRHYFVTAVYDDQSSIGARGGIIVPIDPMFFGLGVVYEGFINCSGTVDECDQVHPEFLIGAAF